MIELAVMLVCLAQAHEVDCMPYELDYTHYRDEPHRIATFPTYIERDGIYEVWHTSIMPTYYVQIECGHDGFIAVDGCAYIDGSRKIFLTWNSLDRLDRFGNSIYWHEVMHAQCLCNWHE